MRWVVEYYEQTDTTQPAEEFEVSLKRHHKKLGAKLRAIAAAIEVYGPQPASTPDLNQASDYWRDYQRTHKISPEEEDQT